MSNPTSSLPSPSEVKDKFHHLSASWENLEKEIRADNLRISSKGLSSEERERLKRKVNEKTLLLQRYQQEMAQIGNELKGKKEKQDMPPPPPPPKTS